MNTIEIHTGRPYTIHLGEGILSDCVPLLQQAYPNRKPSFAIVTDDNVDRLYADALQAQLTAAGYRVCKYAFPHGEASKTLATVQEVYRFLAEHDITRSDVILALGGGVVGDLAGFAAATWLRGIDFVQIPTTFLAMIDSSVGGKTGVDLPEGKNLVGCFWQPSLVICDPLTLETLPEEVFADGIAEAIKYGAILDEALFVLLEQGGLQEHLTQVIGRCITLKKQVVEADERDHGVRQWLNFGHTLGHAIEKQSNFAVSHGKGVAIGMVLVTAASQRHGLTPDGCAQRIAACCAQYHLPTATDYPIEVLVPHCMGDKKRSGANLTLVILEQMGKAGLHTLPAQALCGFFKEDCHG